MLSEETKTTVLAQLRALLEGETDMVARMTNAAALLHGAFGFWWTGFYRVLPADPSVISPETAGADTSHGQLVLGPFQGPVACTHIGYGRGVCGTAWAERRTIVVPDVDRFHGHIACSSESRSEIVVPMYSPLSSRPSEARGEIFAVLDIDSRELGTFSEQDIPFFEEVASIIAL